MIDVALRYLDPAQIDEAQGAGDAADERRNGGTVARIAVAKWCKIDDGDVRVDVRAGVLVQCRPSRDGLNRP
jgi:hypothetical protein